jgi:hypothetical protein
MPEDLDLLCLAESVIRLEAEMKDFPQIDLHSQTLVHGRMAARAIFIPAGSLVTGVKTNHDNISVIVGDVTITTEAGPVRLTGYNIIPAGAGFKRAVVAHADTWWTTIHHTDLTDVEAIENDMTDEPENLQTNRLKALK